MFGADRDVMKEAEKAAANLLVVTELSVIKNNHHMRFLSVFLLLVCAAFRNRYELPLRSAERMLN